MIQNKDMSVVDLEQGFMIAEKIAECHEAAKNLFGERYHEKTQGIREALEALKKKFSCNSVTAGLTMLEFLTEKGEYNGMAILLVCAVVYETAAAAPERSTE